ncbi:putative permease [Granulicella aggregans]|uniref:Putative permease n=1 Tax=Granulicella aggregans TaxID=474949 RepID=A0A7W8E6G6_9BACT|nr:ADOP family duplicated permease [Granulicella aggregans]MBB5060661.1 putative permease [Granulicella aggregans]
MMTILDDLRFTLRQLRRSPAFLLTTVLTLTMAIAANVVVYGVANGLIFHALPIRQAGEVVQVQNPGFQGISFSYPNYIDLRARTSHTFSSLALARFTRFSLGIEGVAQPVWGFMVSGNYFSMLGVQPQLGRLLGDADDDAVDGSPAMVLSDRCWRVRFHADPEIVGKVVAVGKVPFVVVGVAPKGFHGTEQFFDPDAFLPFHDGPEVDGSGGFDRRGSTNAWVFGRLQRGVNREQADANLRLISKQMASEFPKEDEGTDWHTAPVGLLGEALGRPVRLFIGGVGILGLLVLLAACANIGLLFSSRTADRVRELGIRLAIGSSRGRILRQLSLESVIVAALSGAIASALSMFLLRGISQWRLAADLPLELLVDADWKVYVASALLALATGLLFAMLPARQIWRTDPNSTMRASGSTMTSDRSIFRSSLLFVQITLCCLLVTASIVSLRGLQRTFHIPLGFDPHGVTLATVDVRLAGYQFSEQQALQQRLLSAVQAIPGVTMTAYAGNQPLSMNTNDDDVYGPGTTTFDHAHVRASAMVYSVSANYFAATGTKLIAGRAFTLHDDVSAPNVAIVNETLARLLFGTTEAVGRRFPQGGGKETEVVGVVSDGKYISLSEEPTAALFRSILQAPDSTSVLIARSDRDAAEMTIAMRKAVQSVDSSIPIFNVESWPDALGIVAFPARAATLALGVLGALAAMLALTGIFGMASYAVTRRMRELGIRVALGSGKKALVRAALGRTLALIAWGSCIGLALGFASAKLMAGIVYHASANDPIVFVSAVVTMIAIGLSASAVPMRRALRVQPADLLREQ